MSRFSSSVLIVSLVTLSLFPSCAQSSAPTAAAAQLDHSAKAAQLAEYAAKLRQSRMARGKLTAAELLQRRLYAPQEYNVKFKTLPGTATGLAAKTLPGGGTVRVISEIPQLGVKTLHMPDSAVALYQKDPNVEWIEPNAMRYPLQLIPNESTYSTFNTTRNPDFDVYYKWDTHIIQAAEGWELWPGTFFTAADRNGVPAVKIAVIDTGIDYTHPDFTNVGGASSIVTDGGQLYRSLDRTIFRGATTVDAWDGYGHGTHVAGIAAAATNNSTGTVGNGYHAQVISLRVTDDTGNGTSSDLAKAITYAANNGAVICNISLGDYAYSRVEQDAVKYAWNKGMLVVAAAGNDGGAGLPPPSIYPAALSSVLAVSATSGDDTLASYSSWGDWVGIAAPGGDLFVDLVNLFFIDYSVYSTMPTYHVTLNDEGYLNDYDYALGTSLASPEVTGAAALYAGQKGWTTATPGAPLQIWRALQLGADDETGVGGWSPQFGFGRLNIFNMLNLGTVPNPRGDDVGCIVGQVKYKGTPVLNADIVAIDTTTADEFDGTSRADGGYRIPNLPAGTYNITATYFGDSFTLNNQVVPAGCDLPGVDFNLAVFPPRFALPSALAFRVGGSITVVGLLTNTGGMTATNAQITLQSQARLSGQSTTSTVPVVLGSVAAGASVLVNLSFPGSIATGNQVFQVTVSYSGGSSTVAKLVAVP